MDLTHWLTDEEAGKLLRCSPRSIRRYAEQAKIEKRMREVAGRRPEAVYSPQDIQKLMRGPHVMPPEPEVEAPGRGVVLPAAAAAPLQQLFEVLHAAAKALAERPQLPAPSNGKAKPEVPIHEKVWLTLEEAVAYSGLPRRELRNYLRDGTFDAKRFGRRWRVLRTSIERGSLR